MDDIGLLNEYVACQSEEAFAALVKRHINLVYSVALRCVSNQAQAEEITQAVFIILARKAAGLGKNVSLSGWLFNTARLTAANYQRSELRRIHREQEAFMQSQSLPEPAEREVWGQVSPFLDEAMAGLGEKERSAVILRYFEGRQIKEVADTLGTSEEAAKMRISRAVEKLRRFFIRKGIVVSAVVLAGSISANAVQAAPVGLVAAVSVGALKTGMVSASTLTLTKNILNIMAWTKTKTILATGALTLLTAGVATVVVPRMMRGPEVAATAKAPAGVGGNSAGQSMSPVKDNPTITMVRDANANLPFLQVQGKLLALATFKLKKVPDASGWCDALNTGSRIWPETPTNTVFVLNSNVAGRVLGDLNRETVLYFESVTEGWNQAGGVELLARNQGGAVVVLANGKSIKVPDAAVDNLIWAPSAGSSKLPPR